MLVCLQAHHSLSTFNDKGAQTLSADLVHALLPFLFLLLVISFRVGLHIVQAALKIALHLDALALILFLPLRLVLLRTSHLLLSVQHTTGGCDMQ